MIVVVVVVVVWFQSSNSRLVLVVFYEVRKKVSTILRRMHYAVMQSLHGASCLQCFDAVGLVAGRASGL